MTWRRKLAVLLPAVAGAWLLALAFAEAVPPLSQPIAPPPISNPYSVTPIGASAPRSRTAPTPKAAAWFTTAAVPVGTPPRGTVVNDPCQAWRFPSPTPFRHRRCPVWPTPSPYLPH